MKATIYLSDDGVLDFEDFDGDSALDLNSALAGGEQFLTFDMDGATVVVNRDHIVRIEYETGVTCPPCCSWHPRSA